MRRGLPTPRGPLRPRNRRTGPDADNGRPPSRRGVPPNMVAGRPGPQGRSPGAEGRGPSAHQSAAVPLLPGPGRGRPDRGRAAAGPRLEVLDPAGCEDEGEEGDDEGEHEHLEG